MLRNVEITKTDKLVALGSRQIPSRYWDTLENAQKHLAEMLRQTNKHLANVSVRFCEFELGFKCIYFTIEIAPLGSWSLPPVEYKGLLHTLLGLDK